MSKLGVNIDHVATLRQARKGFKPDPILAAQICERAGANSIVAHLREDRRHINENDVRRLKQTVKTRFNLEMSLNEEIVLIAARIKPHQVTLVPERRQELTTEGGLDVDRHFSRVKKIVALLRKRGIEVSLFIDPVKKQLERSKATGASMIELHTGRYSALTTAAARTKEINLLQTITHYGNEIGLTVNAGHGLDYHNTRAVARIQGMEELNIGYSIITHAVFVGLEKAVRDMVKLCRGNRNT